jgi:crotonobetainyl-CoA:carnitine CoA-transferase CaiB-like acyl-CoA transferase
VHQAKSGPLSAERVLDLGSSKASAFCAKMLGDLGAEVVRVVRSGAPTSESPYVEAGSVDRLSEYLFFNTSKLSVELGRGERTAREDLEQLISVYDVLVTDAPDSLLGESGLDLSELLAKHPTLICVELSPFGSTGPYRDFAASHITLGAMAGWTMNCGEPGRTPLQAPANLTETVAGAYAAVATLAAIENRAQTGRGDRVEVSKWEAAITCAFFPSLYHEYGVTLRARDSRLMTGPSFNLKCRDGYIGVNVLTEEQWENLCSFIGRPDMTADPRFADGVTRVQYADETRLAIEASLSNREANEIFHAAQLWRLPFGLIVSPEDALGLPPHLERGFFESLDYPLVGRVQTPRVPFLMSRSASRPFRSPQIGEHTDQVLATRASTPAAVMRRVGVPTPGDGPLSGLRILDLTSFESGPLVTVTAADLGADVIKVEAIQRLDGWRGTGRGGDRPWENAPTFNWINRNKRGITLDLRNPEAVDLFLRLTEISDVVVENYTPRVMANFGLDYASLCCRRSDLIMLSMPGLGQSGSWRDYTAFAYTTEQMSGLCYLTGYPDSGPLFTGTTCGDPLAGLMGGIALLSAVNHRRRTGEGQHIDLSQVEAATTFVADSIVGVQLAEPGKRVGNSHSAMSPHGIFPCAGTDRWIAIACSTETQWKALWQLISAEAPCQDWSKFEDSTLTQRLDQVAEIEALVARWTCTWEPHALMATLQAEGIAAGVVMNGKDLAEDRHLSERRFFIPQQRDYIGWKNYPGQPFRFASGPLPVRRRAPYLGEHNREVLIGLLGLDEADMQALAVESVIGDRPVGFVPR